MAFDFNRAAARPALSRVKIPRKADIIRPSIPGAPKAGILADPRKIFQGANDYALGIIKAFENPIREAWRDAEAFAKAAADHLRNLTAKYESYVLQWTIAERMMVVAGGGLILGIAASESWVVYQFIRDQDIDVALNGVTATTIAASLIAMIFALAGALIAGQMEKTRLKRRLMFVGAALGVPLYLAGFVLLLLSYVGDYVDPASSFGFWSSGAGGLVIRLIGAGITIASLELAIGLQLDRHRPPPPPPALATAQALAEQSAQEATDLGEQVAGIEAWHIAFAAAENRFVVDSIN